MQAAGISGVRPRKRWKTTIRIPGITPATDLVERQFRPDRPNVLWVADITYLRTGEGWLYLAAVQDAYSRQIVGWSMATHMRATLVVDALKMALARRRPEPGLIHHSDQGGNMCRWRSGGPPATQGSRARWARWARPETRTTNVRFDNQLGHQTTRRWNGHAEDLWPHGGRAMVDGRIGGRGVCVRRTSGVGAGRRGEQRSGSWARPGTRGAGNARCRFVELGCNRRLAHGRRQSARGRTLVRERHESTSRRALPRAAASRARGSRAANSVRCWRFSGRPSGHRRSHKRLGGRGSRRKGDELQ